MTTLDVVCFFFAQHCLTYLLTLPCFSSGVAYLPIYGTTVQGFSNGLY